MHLGVVQLPEGGLLVRRECSNKGVEVWYHIFVLPNDLSNMLVYNITKIGILAYLLRSDSELLPNR